MTNTSKSLVTICQVCLALFEFVDRVWYASELFTLAGKFQKFSENAKTLKIRLSCDWPTSQVNMSLNVFESFRKTTS